MQFRLVITGPAGRLNVSLPTWKDLCEMRRECNLDGLETQSFVKPRSERNFRPPLFSDRLY